MDDEARVIAGLTEGEREALANATCEVPRQKDEWAPDCVCSTRYTTFIEQGLTVARGRFPGGMVLTEKGERIRRRILEGRS